MKAKRQSAATVQVKMPPPPRTAYVATLPAHSEFTLTAAEGHELCVSRDADGSVTVFTRSREK